jgi:membrane fusion protein YbhG
MRRRLIPILILALLIGGGYYAWQRYHRNGAERPLMLYGNVDVRQVDLAFKVGGRIAKLDVDEGDRVTHGEVLASLDKVYFTDDIHLEQAKVEAAAANLLKLKNGSRPQEIEQARADLQARQANLANAEITFDRQKHLLEARVTSQQNYDNAEMALNTARAQVAAAKAAYDLVVAGPRIEDIAAARAQLDAEQAQLVELKRRFDDADLVAPNAGIVLTRAREAGAIVQPGETVFTLTLNSPVWVRAYVDEPDLGRVHPGMTAEIHTDTIGGHVYNGTVGFISPLAEFTPKSVETPALRTDLVFRMRIIVSDPDDQLRQGMPVTVTFPDEAGRHD